MRILLHMPRNWWKNLTSCGERVCSSSSSSGEINKKRLSLARLIVTLISLSSANQLVVWMSVPLNISTNAWLKNVITEKLLACCCQLWIGWDLNVSDQRYSRWKIQGIVSPETTNKQELGILMAGRNLERRRMMSKNYNKFQFPWFPYS